MGNVILRRTKDRERKKNKYEKKIDFIIIIVYLLQKYEKYLSNINIVNIF